MIHRDDMNVAAASSIDSARLRRWIRRGVSYIGVLDRLSHEAFVALVQRHQGVYRPYRHGVEVGVLVIGTGDLPITPVGDPYVFPRAQTIDESRFLTLLEPEAGEARACFSLASLAQLLKVSPGRITSWVRAGLIRPVATHQGAGLFDLRQATIARTLLNLTAAGVSTARLRRSLQVLKRWLPVEEPLQQLAVLERQGSILVRLESGELVEADGQLQIEYPRESSGASLRMASDRHADQSHSWHETAIEQELDGRLEDAENSYRKALLEGGPNAQVAFDLAHLLARRGQTEQAIERYRMATELAPKWADSWNNLGLLLAEADQFKEAITALRRAVALSPGDADVRYNLALVLADNRLPTKATTHEHPFR